MKSNLVAMGAMLLLVIGCATSPTGQTQLRLVSASQMTEMGATAFAEIREKNQESQNPRVRKYVQCVADHVAAEVRSNVAWEVRVFEDKQINAFALPGGKIGVYTGLLNVAANQDQLAAIIGHEISHVTADHGNARVSASMATQVGLQVAQVMAGAPSPAKNQILGLLGLGAQVGVLLPYGRGQETESDILGLDLMARAGFDPRAAVDLWRNMSRAAGGQQPPEFLSTHPGHAQRIAEMTRRMPQAMAVYEAAQRQGKRPQCAR